MASSVQSAPIPEVDRRKGSESTHASEVRAMFDRIAPTYDTLNGVLSLGIDRRWRKRAVAELVGGAGGDVLDVCSGTMDFAPLLREAFPRDRIVASDFSGEMLERGKDKAPTVERVVADAMALPFADASFGKIVCGFGVRNLSDPRAGAREALRVLRRGGRFVVLEFFQPERAVTRAFHTMYGDVVLPAVGGLVSGDREAYAYLSKSMKTFLTRRAYADVLREAGFTKVKSFDLLFGIASIVRGDKP